MFTLKKRYKRYINDRWVVFYETTEGEMSQEEVAEKVGVVAGTIIQRIREHGITSPEVTRPNSRKYQQVKYDTVGRADWKGLGSRPRTENLPPSGPGSLEGKYL